MGSARHLYGPEVDDQLEFRRLQDRQIGRLGALENPASVDAALPIRIRNARAVADQTATDGKFAKLYMLEAGFVPRRR